MNFSCPKFEHFHTSCQLCPSLGFFGGLDLCCSAALLWLQKGMVPVLTVVLSACTGLSYLWMFVRFLRFVRFWKATKMDFLQLTADLQDQFFKNTEAGDPPNSRLLEKKSCNFSLESQNELIFLLKTEEFTSLKERELNNYDVWVHITWSLTSSLQNIRSESIIKGESEIFMVWQVKYFTFEGRNCWNDEYFYIWRAFSDVVEVSACFHPSNSDW